MDNLTFTLEADHDYALPSIYPERKTKDGKKRRAPGPIIDLALAVIQASLMLSEDYEFLMQFGPSEEDLRAIEPADAWEIRRMMIPLVRAHNEARRAGDSLSLTYVVPIVADKPSSNLVNLFDY